MPPLWASDSTALAADCAVGAALLTKTPKTVRPRTERHLIGDWKLYWNFIAYVFDCFRKLGLFGA